MVYKAEKRDAGIIAEMAVMLWPGHTAKELEDVFSEALGGSECTVFILELDGKKEGFAQCELRRDYVEGTTTSPVGYLEAIYIKEEYRGRGYAKELLSHCEEWAKEKGCSEFASDCELTNETSFHFHIKAGFTEANRIICFTKKV